MKNQLRMRHNSINLHNVFSLYFPKETLFLKEDIISNFVNFNQSSKVNIDLVTDRIINQLSLHKVNTGSFHKCTCNLSYWTLTFVGLGFVTPVLFQLLENQKQYRVISSACNLYEICSNKQTPDRKQFNCSHERDQHNPTSTLSFLNIKSLRVPTPKATYSWEFTDPNGTSWIMLGKLVFIHTLTKWYEL